jgi:NADPH:quinone reductase
MAEMTRAIGVTKYGGPEALQELELPVEPLWPAQVRVRVTAAAVNPTDTVLRSGRRAGSDQATGRPDVPGMDIAGVVVEIAEAVSTNLAVGDHVMGIVVPQGQHGGYRQDLVLPAKSITRVPSGATYEQAATLPMNGLTAQQTLDVLALRPGQVLAVTGAAGAFGGYVVQLAKEDGLTVVADASETDEPLVRELGADIVVRRGDDVAARIRERFPDGVDGLADGAVLNEAVMPAVKDGGAMATVRAYRNDGWRIRVTPVLVHTYAQEFDKLDRLRDLVEKGKITLRVADTYPAADAAEAHRRLEAGGTRGRLVLRFE